MNDYYNALAARARQLLSKDKTYFTVNEIMELLSNTAEEKIPEPARQQICVDVSTYPYYDCLAIWLGTEPWQFDNRLHGIFVWLLERERYTDRPTLLTDRSYGKQFAAILKSKNIPKETRDLIVASLAVTEALWRIRNPPPNAKALRAFLLDQSRSLSPLDRCERLKPVPKAAGRSIARYRFTAGRLHKPQKSVNANVLGHASY